MKREVLVKTMAKAADGKGVEWVFVRSGGQHDIYRLGGSIQISIPRHREINELTARSILKAGEAEFGEDRWQ